MEFYDVDPAKLDLEVLDIFGTDWALLTAGAPGSWNTMTIGWGGLGTLWSRPVCTVYVRPDRHTHSFLEAHDRFTVAFLNAADHDKLEYCGTHSGRDVDKTTCGLTPMEVDDGAVAFEEAELILGCRILYAQDFERSHFRDESVASAVYGPSVPLHTAYIGLVEHVYIAETALEEHDHDHDHGEAEHGEAERGDAEHEHGDAEAAH